MSNLSLDDLFENPTDFDIELEVPKDYFVESNIYQYVTREDDHKNYYLIAKNKSDVFFKYS